MKYGAGVVPYRHPNYFNIESIQLSDEI